MTKRLLFLTDSQIELINESARQEMEYFRKLSDGNVDHETFKVWSDWLDIQTEMEKAR